VLCRRARGSKGKRVLESSAPNFRHAGRIWRIRSATTVAVASLAAPFSLSPPLARLLWFGVRPAISRNVFFRNSHRCFAVLFAAAMIFDGTEVEGSPPPPVGKRKREREGADRIFTQREKVFSGCNRSPPSTNRSSAPSEALAFKEQGNALFKSSQFKL
jgi:hypothetical protein